MRGKSGKATQEELDELARRAKAKVPLFEKRWDAVEEESAASCRQRLATLQGEDDT